MSTNVLAPPNVQGLPDYLQKWIPELYRALMALYRRKTGLTDAILSGDTVEHGAAQIPSFVLVTAQDSGPTDIYVTDINETTFTINFGGGGSHTFGWSAEA